MSDLIKDFSEFHERELGKWTDAMSTGDTNALEDLSDAYYVTFFSGQQDRPAVYDRDAAIQGMRQSVNALQGATKRFDHKIIRQRSKDSVVVFYEQVIEQDGNELARLFTIESWRSRDGCWEIVRETVEHASM